MLWTVLPLALAPAPAPGQTLSNLASLPVFFTCLAQEPELRREAMPGLGEGDPADENEARWKMMVIDSRWAACVRKKKWVAKAFCADLIEAHTKGTRRDVTRAMEKHRAEYQGLEPMADYFEAWFPKGGKETPGEVPCPE